MTGRRLLIQILSYDYSDYRPNSWSNTQTRISKKWSKLSRRFLKKEMNKEIKDLDY